MTDPRELWNKVYERESEKLPWFGLGFPKVIEKHLLSLDKQEPVLVTGCGVGDVARKLQALGFKNVIGTDISDTAIGKAKERFPGLNFQVCATEDLESISELKGANILDWLNLHQIADTLAYLRSLGETADSLCLAWIYDSNKGVSAKSYVHEGNIFYHDPIHIKDKLEKSGLALTEQFNFSFTTNPASGKQREHKAIGQIYARS